MSAKVQRARGECGRLFQAEVDFARRLARTASELAAIAERDTGDDVLAAALKPIAATSPESAEPLAPKVDPVEVAVAGQGDRLVRLRSQVRSLTAAVEAARRARSAAIENVWRLEAEEKRTEAGRLREQVAAIDKKAEPHLRKLQELYGCRFVPAGTVTQAAAAVSFGTNGGTR